MLGKKHEVLFFFFLSPCFFFFNSADIGREKSTWTANAHFIWIAPLAPIHPGLYLELKCANAVSKLYGSM